jgi:hypothetical protein
MWQRPWRLLLDKWVAMTRATEKDLPKIPSSISQTAIPPGLQSPSSPHSGTRWETPTLPLLQRDALWILTDPCPQRGTTERGQVYWVNLQAACLHTGLWKQTGKQSGPIRPIVLIFFFFGSTGVWTWGLALARQPLYNLSHPTNPLSNLPL